MRDLIYEDYLKLFDTWDTSEDIFMLSKLFNISKVSLSIRISKMIIEKVYDFKNHVQIRRLNKNEKNILKFNPSTVFSSIDDYLQFDGIVLK